MVSGGFLYWPGFVRPFIRRGPGWQKLLELGGDPARGSRRFFSRETNCTTCHQFDGIGGTVGPDLTDLALSQDRSTIIRSLLRPSDYFDPDYQSAAVVTHTGVTHTGLFQGITGENITLLSSTGEKIEIPTGQVASYQAIEQSVMPDNLENLLTIESLRDLVAFLSDRG